MSDEQNEAPAPSALPKLAADEVLVVDDFEIKGFSCGPGPNDVSMYYVVKKYHVVKRSQTEQADQADVMIDVTQQEPETSG